MAKLCCSMTMGVHSEPARSDSLQHLAVYIGTGTEQLGACTPCAGDIHIQYCTHRHAYCRHLQTERQRWESNTIHPTTTAAESKTSRTSRDLQTPSMFIKGHKFSGIDTDYRWDMHTKQQQSDYTEAVEHLNVYNNTSDVQVFIQITPMIDSY